MAKIHPPTNIEQNSYEVRSLEFDRLSAITARINAGLLLEEILEQVYVDFRDVIPYNRIGLALIDEGGMVRARWARSDQGEMKLGRGYQSPLEGSSLENILKTGQPRILNNLVDYLKKKPGSESTALVVSEGIRSSLTCPLVANGKPVGFLFFSSIYPNTYDGIHVEIFKRIAGQLSVIVEKGRLVSEIVAQKEAIEKQNAELKRLNELKNRFIGMAAHDLRGPITNIKLGTDVLIQSFSWPSEKEREEFLEMFLEAVENQTQHMLSMLNDLLDISQIEAGHLNLRVEPVEIRQYLKEIIDLHNQVAARKGTRVLLEAVHKGKVVVDPRRLRQVVDNLISNAVKYSPPGSTVRVSALFSSDGWKVAVKDEGPGIAEEEVKLLFQDFSRLSSRPTGGEKSVGLGLAISRRVIEAHGGEIGVDSRPGQGSTFWFTIPSSSRRSTGRK